MTLFAWSYTSFKLKGRRAIFLSRRFCVAPFFDCVLLLMRHFLSCHFFFASFFHRAIFLLRHFSSCHFFIASFFYCAMFLLLPSHCSATRAVSWSARLCACAPVRRFVIHRLPALPVGRRHLPFGRRSWSGQPRRHRHGGSGRVRHDAVRTTRYLHDWDGAGGIHGLAAAHRGGSGDAICPAEHEGERRRRRNRNRRRM